MPTKKMYKKKRSSAPRRKMYRRRPASLGNLRVFTETLQVSDLACSSNLGSSGPGQSWGLSMASIPQIAQYKALYNEFKILKIRYQFIPWFNSDEKNQFYQNIGAGGTVETVPMLAYCVQRDAGSTPPATELSVLQQNGCKIVPFSTKSVSVTVTKPQPEIAVSSTTGGGLVNMESTTWLDINTGLNVAHYGLQTYVTSAGTAACPFSVGRVYAHITFALRSAK